MNNGATTATINNLVKATYSVTITDVNGCTKTVSSGIAQPAKLNVNFTNVVSACGFGWQ